MKINKAVKLKAFNSKTIKDAEKWFEELQKEGYDHVQNLVSQETAGNFLLMATKIEVIEG